MRSGIDSLYAHQADALARIRAGEDVVVVTSTASGKSLCYEIPVLQSLAEDPSSRALFLFPTKALGQDQVAAIRGLAPPPAWTSRRPRTTGTPRRPSGRRRGPRGRWS